MNAYDRAVWIMVMCATLLVVLLASFPSFDDPECGPGPERHYYDDKGRWTADRCIDGMLFSVSPANARVIPISSASLAGSRYRP